MSLPSGRDFQIQDVIKSISDGEYRIPCFQRNYVWDVNKVADLVDSLLKGYPIGSVILWRTKISLSEHKKIGGFDFPARDDGKYTSYVIDGQQRLTSLFVAFKGLSAGNSTDCSKMCIKLTASDNERIVYASIPNGANTDEFVFLKELYNATAITGSYADKRLTYYQTILQYKISVIQIDDESLELSQVVDIFERLNLGGKRLSLFSIIAARSYAQKTNTDEGF